MCSGVDVAPRLATLKVEEPPKRKAGTKVPEREDPGRKLRNEAKVDRMSVLVIAEHDNQSVNSATLNTVAAAAKIGGDIVVLVAGSNCSTAGRRPPRSRAQESPRADAPHYKDQLAENIAPLVAGLAGAYTHVCCLRIPSEESRAARRCAARCGADLRHLAVASADTFVRRSMRECSCHPCGRRTRSRSSPCERRVSTPFFKRRLGPRSKLFRLRDAGLSSSSGARSPSRSARADFGALVVSAARMGSGIISDSRAARDKLGAAMGASRAA